MDPVTLTLHAASIVCSLVAAWAAFMSQRLAFRAAVSAKAAARFACEAQLEIKKITHPQVFIADPRK